VITAITTAPSGLGDSLNPVGVLGTRMLQGSLRDLAAQYSDYSIDPARYDGTMTLGTIIAIRNAAKRIGTQIHPLLGQAISFTDDIMMAPLKPIPYAEQVINLLLSPWIIDAVFNAVIGVMQIIPGAGDAGNAARVGAESLKTAIAAASGALSAAIELAKRVTPQPSNFMMTLGPGQNYSGGLGATHVAGVGRVSQNGLTWYRPSIHGPLGHGRVRLRNHSLHGCRSCSFGDFAGLPANVTVWPAGKAIDPRDWSGRDRWRGPAPTLHPADLALWQQRSARRDLRAGNFSVANGAFGFKTFIGADGGRFGVYYDGHTLTIRPVSPKFQTTRAQGSALPNPGTGGLSGFWDDVGDVAGDIGGAIGGAIGATLGAISDAGGSVVNWTGSQLASAWDAIGDQVLDIADTIRTYGCAIMRSDIIVAVAAAGAGIVATPAASAAVVAGSVAGRAACAAIDVTELVYQIVKLLSMDFPAPPQNQNDTATQNIHIMMPIIAWTPSSSLVSAASAFGTPRAGAAASLAADVPPVGKILLPLPTTTQPPAVYPSGTIQAFDLSRSLWLIAIPQ
jgi:hypothetical protein